MKISTPIVSKRTALISCVLSAIGLAVPTQAEFTMNSGDISTSSGNHINVADIRLSNGNVVKFVVTPDTGEVHVGEIVQVGDSEQFILDDKMLQKTPLEVFKSLTPNDVAIPRILINYGSDDTSVDDAEDGINLMDAQATLESAQKRKQRPIIDADNLELFVDVAHINVDLKAPNIKAASGGSCGADGYNYFVENHCGTYGAYGYGPSETDCDAGLSSWIQRTSSKAMRNQYTRMVTCGTTGKLIHSRKTGNGFQSVFTYHQNSNAASGWTTYKKGWPWKRRARFERKTNSGGVRGWTRYHKYTAAP